MAAQVAEFDPDILLLTDFDYDAEGRALAVFAKLFGTRYPHLYARPPNAGVQSGHDLDRNGRLGEPRDAWGYGRFAGDGGMALLSALPVAEQSAIDLTRLRWRDVPGAVWPQLEGQPFWDAEVADVMPVSSTGHWVVPVETVGGRLDLLAWSATPPVFDGPEDANGLRNRAGLAVWEAWLDGGLEGASRESRPFVLLGNANLDPSAGQGDRAAMARFLGRAELQDPLPSQPTAHWPDGPGRLRVSYVLPDRGLRVIGAGVTALPEEVEPMTGPHALVWVDLEVPP